MDLSFLDTMGLKAYNCKQFSSCIKLITNRPNNANIPTGTIACVNEVSSVTSEANYIKSPSNDKHNESRTLCLAQELLHLDQHSNLDDNVNHMQDFDYLQSLSSKQYKSLPGLGIISFLKDKNIFITGATGFLAKVLVEKILRVQPNVRQLYLLINAKDARWAKIRLKEEILCSNLFKFLQCRYGEEYEAFMDQKITAVVGDITKETLGMDPLTFTSLTTKLDIIVNSAGTTTFDERYDHALNLNTEGPRRIMEFAKSCQQLQLVMHVSTAFAHGKREGILHEKTFNPGYNIASETMTMGENLQPKLFVDFESKLVKEKLSSFNSIESTIASTPSSVSPIDPHREKLLTSAMKELGLERAKLFGWQDTYVFTKALGEMVIDNMCDDLPTVIMRPSIVESSFREPIPGWIEGNRMMDPLIIAYGKGQLDGFLMDPNGVLDVVPVDMVANAMLAAMAKHACKAGLQVYQVASSLVNPFFFSNFVRLLEEQFQENPFLDSEGQPINTLKIKVYPDMHTYMEALSRLNLETKGLNPKLVKRNQQIANKLKEHATYLANIYQPYTFYAGRFDTSNAQELHENLSPKEKELFGFNINDIDWETYIKQIHIPGLRKHVLKGRA